ncbi:MAG: hypothetical protein QXS90_00380 [Candidatus Diapherotrites archaeon]
MKERDLLEFAKQKYLQRYETDKDFYYDYISVYVREGAVDQYPTETRQQYPYPYLFYEKTLHHYNEFLYISSIRTDLEFASLSEFILYCTANNYGELKIISNKACFSTNFIKHAQFEAKSNYYNFLEHTGTVTILNCLGFRSQTPISPNGYSTPYYTGTPVPCVVEFLRVVRLSQV